MIRRLPSDERRALTRLAFGLALTAMSVGAVALGWAYNRDYHDNQRNWALAAGWLGLLGGQLLLLVSALLWPGRRDRP